MFVATPKQIGVDANWATIAAGFYHSLAIWGEGAFGKLGNGATSNNLIPVKIGDGNNWHSVSASPFHSLALKNDGTLWACGRNAYGEIGDGTRTEKDTFIKIGNDTNWKYILSGNGISNCLKKNNTLWVCGAGLLGNGENFSTDTLIQINSFFSNTWVGGVSDLWNNPENWSCKCLPNEYSNVLIKKETIYLNQNAGVNSLKLYPSANLTIINGSFLNIQH